VPIRRDRDSRVKEKGHCVSQQDEVTFCRGGISFITKPTLRELVTANKCGTLPKQHVRMLHERRIPCATEEAFQWASRL